MSVAKIEGNQGYRSMMRSLATENYSPHKPREDWYSACHETIKRFTPQFVSKELERWQAPFTPPINAMLLALQAATEAYLGAPLNTSDLVVPTRFSESNQNLLDLEFNRLRLRRNLGGFPSALEAAIYAKIMPRDRSYPYGIEETRLILAVDYSRSALTAGLFIDDSGALNDHRFIQDVNIGADASPSHLPWSAELQLERRRLLEKATKLPATDAGFELPQEISELLLIGDRAYDDQLLALLEEILGTRLVARIRDTAQYDGPDPIFIAAKSIASLAKQKIDEGGQSCLAWDCKGLWDEWMAL